MTVTSAPVERSAGRFFMSHRTRPTALARRTLIGDLAAYASARRKWWLLPIIVLLAPFRLLVSGKKEARQVFESTVMNPWRDNRSESHVL
jgi:hypothetical protein